MTVNQVSPAGMFAAKLDAKPTIRAVPGALFKLYLKPRLLENNYLPLHPKYYFLYLEFHIERNSQATFHQNKNDVQNFHLNFV